MAKCPNQRYTERARERMAMQGLPQISEDIKRTIDSKGEEYAAVIDPHFEDRFEGEMAQVWAELAKRREDEIVASGGSVMEED